MLAVALWVMTAVPPISAELAMDSVAGGPVPRTGSFRLAFGAGMYLAVWSDGRSGLGDVWAARISTAGSVLDQTGIAVSAGALSEGDPAVAFDGTRFLVVWVDGRSGVQHLYGARVATDGTVVDPNGVPISTAGNDELMPDVAFDGLGYLVVWATGAAGNADIAGLRLATDLTPRSAPFRVSQAAGNQAYPRVASNGSMSLVVWRDERVSFVDADIYGLRIGQDGTIFPGQAQGFPICDTPGVLATNPTVVANATGFVVAWSDNRNGNEDVIATRVTTTGALLDVPGLPVAVAGNSQTLPHLDFDGTNVIAIWLDLRNGLTGDVRGARITAGGMVLDPTGIVFATGSIYANYPQVIFGGGQHFLAFMQDGQGMNPLLGARLSVAPLVALEAPFPLARAASTQEDVAIASDGADFLVVWSEARGLVTGRDIYGARLTRTGLPPVTMSFVIAAAPDQQYAPKVTFGAGNYFVVWSDRRLPAQGLEVFGARVSPAGAVLDGAGINLSNRIRGQEQPAVAAAASGYLVVWTDTASAFDTNIQGVRVSAAGMVLDVMPIDVTLAMGYQAQAAVASSGGAWLVAWSDARAGTADYDVWGTRVSAAGAVLDPGGLPLGVAPFWQLRPSVHFDGTAYVVGWSDGRNMRPSGDEGFVRRFASTTGAPLGAGLLFSDAGFTSALAVGYDDAGCWLAYATAPSFRSDLVGLQLDGQLAVREGPFALAASPENEQSPALAFASGGYGALAYQRYDGAPQVRATRAFARMLGPLVAGASCSAPAGCASGFCVTGVCCASLCPSGSCTSGTCVTELDAGRDAGAPDGGTPDAGGPDGGPADAGGADAGDAGSAVDAGTPLVAQVRFGCDASGGVAAWLLVLVALSQPSRAASRARRAPPSARRCCSSRLRASSPA